MNCTATRPRTTSGSEITITSDLDGIGLSRISTGVGFYGHMLTTLSGCSLIDLDIQVSGDVHIDGHHVIEDTAIVPDQALGEALGDRHGIRCYVGTTVPLGEALTHCVVDTAGRLYVVCSGEPEGQAYTRIGGSGVTYAGSVTYHIFESLGSNAGLCIHLRFLTGRDPYHIVEAECKALARALRDAVALDPRIVGVPSVGGALWIAGWGCSAAARAACTPRHER